MTELLPSHFKLISWLSFSMYVILFAQFDAAVNENTDAHRQGDDRRDDRVFYVDCVEFFHVFLLRLDRDFPSFS